MFSHGPMSGARGAKVLFGTYSRTRRVQNWAPLDPLLNQYHFDLNLGNRPHLIYMHLVAVERGHGRNNARMYMYCETFFLI